MFHELCVENIPDIEVVEVQTFYEHYCDSPLTSNVVYFSLPGILRQFYLTEVQFLEQCSNMI